jgi:hypothetical protein
VIGRATGKHYLLYSGEHRFESEGAVMGAGPPG